MALIVRQASLHVWKVVVTNTARTLREILPTLIHLLLGCLASNSHDKRKVAARTLGDLVRKLGERVLPEVIPMLEHGTGSESTKERQGVCIGLSEIIQQTSREHVLLYMESLLPTVQNSLCDRDPDVRAAAALTFDSLHSAVGQSHNWWSCDSLTHVLSLISYFTLLCLVPQYSFLVTHPSIVSHDDLVPPSLRSSCAGRDSDSTIIWCLRR